MAVEEVLEHPLIDLLRNPCCDGKVPLLNQFDLFELTQLYQELTGRAYWYIEHDGLGRPRAIWILDPQQVRPIQRRGSERVIDGYEVGRGADRRLYAPEEVIGFRVPDPLDPQLGGFSPLAAVFERIHVTRRYLSQTRAILENRARPDAVISPSHPDGVIGEAEAKRLEASFNQRFRGSGAGGVLVAKDSLRIEPLSFNPKDLGELAENQVSFEHIARAFDIPLALLHRDVNRASAEQGRLQHAKDAILPRITRLQEQLNQRLVPLYDTTGRLFLAFDDPVPENVELELRIRESNLRLGVTTINEERAALGLEPVGE
jgi:HK97 family phage portal protein